MFMEGVKSAFPSTKAPEIPKSQVSDDTEGEEQESEDPVDSPVALKRKRVAS